VPSPGSTGIMDQMPSHEEGEFELVLGNKQLLSVFFLVILLLAVFFSMGYIVGRNTAPANTLSANNRTPPILVEPAGAPTTTPDPTKPSALQNPEPPVKPPAKAEPPVKTQPVKVDPPKPEPVKPAPTKVEPPKPVPVAKTEPPKPEPVKPAPMTKAGESYLQVVATKRPDAEKLVSTLTQKGFRASISPVPDSALVRVLVGPFSDAGAIAKNKDGLQAIGYKPIVRKF